jgi:hypothetical protein
MINIYKGTVSVNTMQFVCEVVQLIPWSGMLHCAMVFATSGGECSVFQTTDQMNDIFLLAHLPAQQK